MMTVKFRPGSLITCFFFLFLLVAAVVGWGWPFIAKLMPVYFAAIPGTILCLVQLYRDLMGWQERGEMDNNRGIQMDEIFIGGLDPRVEVIRTLTFFVWFGGGALAIWLLGIVIALPLLVLFYHLIEDGRENWKVSLILGIGVFVFLRGLFEYALEIQWPSGALFR